MQALKYSQIPEQWIRAIEDAKPSFNEANKHISKPVAFFSVPECTLALADQAFIVTADRHHQEPLVSVRVENTSDWIAAHGPQAMRMFVTSMMITGIPHVQQFRIIDIQP